MLHCDVIQTVMVLMQFSW